MFSFVFPRAVRVAAVLFSSVVGLSAQAATLKQFTPQGQIEEQQRVSVVFSDDMVKMGDTSARSPFSIQCAATRDAGRWADARTWVLQLDRSLAYGERCQFTLRPDLKTLAGQPVSGKNKYEFFTSNVPYLRNMMPREGAIEEDQAFLINAHTALKASSIEKNMWCEVSDLGQRIPVRVLSNKDRKAILAEHGMTSADTAVAVQCVERLPSGAKMQLVWGKGVEALAGGLSDKEKRYPFHVREPFRAEMSCERERANRPCTPLSGIQLSFNAPIDRKLMGKISLKAPDGLRKPSELNHQAEESTFSSLSFAGPFPQNAELSLELPKDLKDEAGRVLTNAKSFPLKVHTAGLPPLAKFPGAFGIVELKEGGLLPLTLRNVETKIPMQIQRVPSPNAHNSLQSQRLTDDVQVIRTMMALERFEAQSGTVRATIDGEERVYDDPNYARELSFFDKKAKVEKTTLPKPNASQEFEVLGVPLGKPGYHVLEIKSQLLGKALLANPKPMYVRASALVTNMSIHLKTGTDNALVWVTSLDKGFPVALAEVRVLGCDGKLQWQGQTDSQGRAFIQQALKKVSCKHDGTSDNFLFVSARSGEDYSFVRSDWNQGIEPWRFGVQTWGMLSSLNIHTVFDRTLFRPGQMVSMKHIARSRNSSGFLFPDQKGLPTKLTITHMEEGTEYTQNVDWSQNGSAVNQWKVPESAKLGNYSVSLSGGPHGQQEVGTFRVSDFRLPVFTGRVQGTSASMVAPDQVPLSLGLSFLNGGAAKNAEVEVSATVRPRWPEYTGYDDFNFYLDFDEEAREAFNVSDNRQSETLVLDKQALRLDAQGAGKLDVKLPEKPRGPSELYTEMTFTDPNGEIQTIHGLVELSAAAVNLGMRIVGRYEATASNQRVKVVALDVNGKPLVGQSVRVLGKQQINYSHRRRIVGGFYAYENNVEFKDLGEVCSGKTDSRGLLNCQFEPENSGSFYLLAEAKDKQGHVARAGGSFWASTGGGDDWFSAGNQDRFDVIPDKRSYQSGEVAKLQAQTPFAEGMALVSVEAGGILDTYVQPLSRFKPIIELPIKAEWGPNAYVSVLTVRGRVQPLTWTSFFKWGWREPITWFKSWWNPLQPTAMVDLAKPAYRIGLAELGVGVEGFRLNVEVKPDKTDYRPREEATVTIKVTDHQGKPAPVGSELALAAVDQALLELRPNDTWALLEAMMQKRGYEVSTATAQSQVIGKRHFGKKAVPAGGGGGHAPARELFDTLLSWQPRIKLDAQGQAKVKVSMNDSLSAFQFVGIATAGTQLFGTGSATVKTRQDLQMISGLPPVVREGDQFNGLLTVRNGTARAMAVAVKARYAGQDLPPQTLKLAPEGAQELMWPAKVPDNLSSLAWEFSVQEQGTGKAQDALKITQQVTPATPVTVQQATFMRIEAPYSVETALPVGALPNKGGLEIALTPKLATVPPGVRRYFENYPYACLEQQTSKAIGLQDKQRWQTMTDNLPVYLDATGLARYFPADGLSGDVSLTAYVLDMAALAETAYDFKFPEAPKRQMLNGLLAYLEGRIKPSYWAPPSVEGSLSYKLLALEALTRHGEKPVRGAAALDVDPLRLSTGALLDWYLSLKRMGNDWPERAAKLQAATQELRNRLSYTGGRLNFTTEKSDFWWWMMISGDSNAFRLIEAVMDDSAWREDLPKLVRGALERQVRGQWMTTTSNAWATVALDIFAKKYERDTVSGTTLASLGKTSREFNWKNEVPDNPGLPASAPLSLPWPNPLNSSNNKLSIQHKGSGKPWATVQVVAAVPITEPKHAGYRVSKTVTPVQEKVKGKVSRGDIWRVTLNVQADQDMTWVALSDPIPAGAKILGDGDGRDSSIATQDEHQGGHGVWPSFVERTFGFFRAYYAVVPQGSFQVSYTVRINNEGEFNLPATRVEAMYAPDVFGEWPNKKVTVQ